MPDFGDNDVAPAGVSPCEAPVQGEPGGGEAAEPGTPPAGGTAPTGGAALSSDSSNDDPNNEETHWIEIELVEEGSNNPVPGEEYCIKLPDGSEVRGTTDEEGKAKVELLESAGQAKVSFPRLDRRAWEPA